MPIPYIFTNILFDLNIPGIYKIKLVISDFYCHFTVSQFEHYTISHLEAVEYMATHRHTWRQVKIYIKKIYDFKVA